MKDIPLEKKVTFLQKSNVFSSLKNDELEILAGYSETVKYKENEILYRTGSEAAELYIIVDGEILITKNTKDNQSIDLACFISGECFGELDLFNKSTHNTNAISLKTSSVLVFPGKGTDLDSIFSKYPEIKAQILYKLLITVAGRIRKTNKQISEKTPWIEDLKRQLHKDKLTGLYNKTYLDDELETILSKFQHKISLLVIKPDNFKDINDNYGHETGDNALKLLGSLIASSLEENVIVARYKGDEFAVVLPEKNYESAKKISFKLKNVVSDQNINDILKGNDFYIKVSIGISNSHVHSDNSKELIAIAYKNMFEARNAGGDRVV